MSPSLSPKFVRHFMAKRRTLGKRASKHQHTDRLCSWKKMQSSGSKKFLRTHLPPVGVVHLSVGEPPGGEASAAATAASAKLVAPQMSLAAPRSSCCWRESSSSGCRWLRSVAGSSAGLHVLLAYPQPALRCKAANARAQQPRPLRAPQIGNTNGTTGGVGDTDQLAVPQQA